MPQHVVNVSDRQPAQCQPETHSTPARPRSPRLAAPDPALFLTLEIESLSGRGAGLAVAGEERAGWSSDPAGRNRANRIGQAFRHRLIGTWALLFIARPSPWALVRKREFRGRKLASRIDEDPIPRRLGNCDVASWSTSLDLHD